MVYCLRSTKPYKAYVVKNHSHFEAIASFRYDKQDYEGPESLLYITGLTMTRAWILLAFESLRKRLTLNTALDAAGLVRLGVHWGAWEERNGVFGDMLYRFSPPRDLCPLDRLEANEDKKLAETVKSHNIDDRSTENESNNEIPKAAKLSSQAPESSGQALAKSLANTHLVDPPSRAIATSAPNVPQPPTFAPLSGPPESVLRDNREYLDQCVLFQAIRIKPRRRIIGKTRREWMEDGVLVVEVDPESTSSPLKPTLKKHKSADDDDEEGEGKDESANNQSRYMLRGANHQNKDKEVDVKGKGKGRAITQNDEENLDIDVSETPSKFLNITHWMQAKDPDITVLNYLLKVCCFSKQIYAFACG